MKFHEKFKKNLNFMVKQWLFGKKKEKQVQYLK